MSQNDPKLVDYGAVLGLWALRFMIFTLLILSFDWLWKELIETDWINSGFTIIMAAIFSIIGVCFSYFGNRQFYSMLSFALLYIFCLYMVMQTYDDLYALYFQVVTNIVLVIAGVWLIIKGIKEV